MATNWGPLFLTDFNNVIFFKFYCKMKTSAEEGKLSLIAVVSKKLQLFSM